MGQPQQVDSFYVAPFAIVGKPLGVGRWRLSDLSPKWLGVCDDMLRDLGPRFRTSPGRRLRHIEVKLTSVNGAALATFYARGAVAAMTACLRGQVPRAESEVVRMFVDSLRRVPAIRQDQTSPSPFERMTELRERPLQIVVPWPAPGVSDADHDVVQEFAVHFAAAYLCRYNG